MDIEKNLKQGHYDEGDTATNICLGKYDKKDSETVFISQTNFDYHSLHFGNLTIYRFRLTCHCKFVRTLNLKRHVVSSCQWTSKAGLATWEH